MAQHSSDNIQCNAPKSLDNRYGKIVNGKTVPYSSIYEALQDPKLSILARFQGMTILINSQGTITEYWWVSGLTDEDLSIKNINISIIFETNTSLVTPDLNTLNTVYPFSTLNPIGKIVSYINLGMKYQRETFNQWSEWPFNLTQ